MNLDNKMRAHQAQLLLDNQIFQEALEEVNKSINREMDSIKLNDKDSAYQLIQLRQAANKIVNYINTVATCDKVPEFNARKKRSLFRA